MNNKIIKKVAIFMLLAVSLVALVGAVLIGSFVNSKQFVALDFGKLNNTKNTITLLDFYGNKIDEPLYVDRYKQAKVEQLNQYTLDAFVSVEDKRFYKHKGIDVRRIVGAIINNARAGTLKEGASTITQQLIKNTHLDNKKTARRKLNEIVLAKQLEQQFSKGEILQTYLNTVYFGKNAYGIESASNVYFDKSATELTLSESAILAGMLKAPNSYNPTCDLKKCIARRDVVLKTMLDNGYIDKNQYENAKNEQLVLTENKNIGIETSYTYQVLQEVCSITNMSVLQAINSNLVVYTYYKPICQQSLEYSIKNNTTSNYCATICDNDSCGVVAFCAKGRNSLQKRQAGSALKPLAVYAPALEEEKITLSTPVLDEKTTFAGYSPKNYNDEYLGWTTIKNSIAKSLNVPSVKVLNSIGIDTSTAYLNKLGLKNIDSEQNLSLALGNVNGGVEPIELANCYLTLANGGTSKNLAFVEKIENDFGTIYTRKTKQKQVFSPQTAYLITDALKEVSKTGTAKALSELKFDVAVKTGTVGDKNGNTDAIVCGYTTEQTYCIWLNSQNKSNFTGGGEPTRVLKGYLDINYKENLPASFEIPPNIVKVGIDKAQLEQNQRQYLAKLEENSKNKQYFYYKKGTEPKEFANKYNNIDFAVETDRDFVKIEIERESDLTYKIIKGCDGCWQTISMLGTSYLDNEVQLGKIYEYTIEAYFGNNLVARSKTIKVTIPSNRLQQETAPTPIDDLGLWQELKKLLYPSKN